MEFSCVGFEIKAWPWKGSLNVDDTGWDIHEKYHLEALDRFALRVNEYQLLEIQHQALLDSICDWVAVTEDCQLVAIQFPRAAVRILDEKRGYSTADIKLDLSRFVCRGLDVCDFNGLFSALHDTRLAPSSNLLQEQNLIGALELTLAANVLDRSHCPFVVAKVYSLK